MADTLTSLLESISTLIDKLELIGFGDKTTDVTHNGVTRPAVAKQINDSYAQIQAMVDGQIPYETLALATAAGAPPLDSNGYHKLVRVVGDSTSENNGIYYWSGSGLVKSDYDPIESAKSVVDSIKSQLTTSSVGLYGATVTAGGASVSSQSYLLEEQATGAGVVQSVTIEALAGGTLYVGVYRESPADIFTRTASAAVSVSVTGVQTIDVSGFGLDVESGDRIAFGGPISYRSGGTSSGFRQFATNAATATAATVVTSSTINCSAEIAYSSLPASASNMASRDTLIAAAQSAADAAVADAAVANGRVGALEGAFSETISTVVGNAAAAGSAVSALSFLIEDPLPAGQLESVNFYSPSAGSVTIGLYSQSGDTFTRKWFTTVTVASAGEQSVDLLDSSVLVEAGDKIAFAGKITYLSPSPSTGFRQFATNAATATTATVVTSSAILANATVQGSVYFVTKPDYTALKQRVDGAVFDLSTVDRIVTVGDSYTEAIGVLKTKSYTMRVSALSEYNFSSYALGGRTAAAMASDIVTEVPRFGSSFSGWSAKYATIALNENDKNAAGLTDAQYYADLEQLVSVIRQQGVEPIICTEWGGAGAFTQSGDQRNVSGLAALAQKLGVGFIDVASDGRLFNVVQHADFWKSNHPATRTMYLMADPIRRGLSGLLPRPEKSIKIFRARDSASAAADAVFASLLERNEHWQEISIGHTALSETEKLNYDTATALYAGTQTIADEYLQLIAGSPVEMGMMALIDVVAPRVGGDYAVDLGASVFDSASAMVQTSSGLVWVPVTVTDGVATVPADFVRGGGFSLLLESAAGVQLYAMSVSTESGVPKQDTQPAHAGAFAGTEALPQPLLDSSALAGWATTGTVAAISPADGCLPYSTSGCVTVSESDTIRQQLSITAEPRPRRARIEVWARRWVDKFDPASDFSTAAVQYDSWDERTLRVVQSVPAGGSIAVHEDSVGLWWTRVQFDAVIPSFIEQSIEISCTDGDLQVAFVSVVVE